MPGVLEGVNPAGGVGAFFFVEEGIMVLGGIEGRVEINEVNGFVLEVTPEDVEVVAVIERAHAASVRGKPGGGKKAKVESGNAESGNQGREPPSPHPGPLPSLRGSGEGESSKADEKNQRRV